MDTNNLQIIEFLEIHSKAFADLNYEWIDHFFEIEEIDRKYLDYPQEMIIDKGGAIILAEYQNNIVGTIALIKVEKKIYELAKMSVAPNLRGKKIGHLLMEACIEKAKALGADKMIILSNRKLKNAKYLYEKFGFKDLGSPDTEYERCDIYMELALHN